jgi:hypothetical protein
MPGGPNRNEGPNLIAVVRKDNRRTEKRSGLGVISMRMSEDHPLNAAVDGPAHGLEVRNRGGPRIDHPPPDHVRVRPVQCQGGGIVCAHAYNRHTPRF